MATDVAKKENYFLSKVYLMMYIVQKLGNSKCNTPLSEFFRNQVKFLYLFILWLT